MIKQFSAAGCIFEPQNADSDVLVPDFLKLHMHLISLEHKEMGQIP
jgi:hypothetical protein